MKSPEQCFLEICNNINCNNINCNNINYNNVNFKIDSGEKISTSITNYSKMHNYEGEYVYDGYIILEKDIAGCIIEMSYYFSNKRRIGCKCRYWNNISY